MSARSNRRVTAEAGGISSCVAASAGANGTAFGGDSAGSSVAPTASPSPNSAAAANKALPYRALVRVEIEKRYLTAAAVKRARINQREERNIFAFIYLIKVP